MNTSLYCWHCQHFLCWGKYVTVNWWASSCCCFLWREKIFLVHHFRIVGLPDTFIINSLRTENAVLAAFDSERIVLATHTKCCWSLAARAGRCSCEASGMLMAKEKFRLAGGWSSGVKDASRISQSNFVLRNAFARLLHGREEGRTNGNPLDFANITLDSHFWNASRNLVLGVFLYSSCEIFPEH